MKFHRFLAACALTGAMLISGCNPSSSMNGDWTKRGHDDDNTHYSPLKQIDASSVKRLGLEWSLDLPGEHTLSGTPIEVDGTLYFSGQGATIYAVDAVSGKQLWRYDPEPWTVDSKRLRLTYLGNRGVAYSDGRVIVGTHDGRLIAVDAKTGKLDWSVRTFDTASKLFITGAPQVFKDKVIVGNGGGDYGERGFVTAYDVKTGKQVWRFYTAPGKPEDNAGDPIMEMAAKTWSGEYWKTGTGGTVWHGMTFDRELNQVYLGTGNSGPYNPAVRSPGDGDNLFLVSIVALDADTGKYVWHYQLNPREAWDYKAVADIILADLKIGGQDRKVLMQAPTNGFFYVLDRKTGKVISAEKIGKVTWAERIDLKTGRPVEAPNIRYETGETTIYPSSIGAHNWQSMSYSPQSGLVYIPYMQVGATYRTDPKAALGGVVTKYLVNGEGDGKGKLLAWDPVTQKPAWSAPRQSIWNGGIISTGGGVVFQGTEDGFVEAFNARTGEQLWKFDAKLGIIATPMTYQVKGKQYVSVLVGYGAASAALSDAVAGGWKYNAQPRRLLTFALDGKAQLPETAPRDMAVHAVDDKSLKIDDAAAKRGAKLFHEAGVCFVCHGVDLKSPGAPGPDLREAQIPLSQEGFAAFVRAGSPSTGMPSFPELTDAQTRDLYMYIRGGAREALGQRKKMEHKGSPATM